MSLLARIFGLGGKGTVETALRDGLEQAGLSLEDAEITALADAIESEHGSIDVADVLRR